MEEPLREKRVSGMEKEETKVEEMEGCTKSEGRREEEGKEEEG